MDWSDSEEIGIALYEKYADLDPLTVRFTELHRMVVGLDEFKGEPHAADESKLEAIQMAWLEEKQLDA